MGIKVKDKSVEVNAGPGSYAYNPSTTQILSQSAKWGFGSSKRKGAPDAKVPGPGEY